MQSLDVSTLLKFMDKLPLELENEIYNFVIPNHSPIHFSQLKQVHYDCNYNTKYEVAFNNKNQLIKTVKNTNKRLFLSRIPKKNGKHRYYVTTEICEEECDSCGWSNCKSSFHMRYCYGEFEKNYKYTSKYVGKNLNYAMVQLLNYQ